MRKIYLVKKNPELPADGNNWLVMNSFEFRNFIQTPEGQKRRDRFGQLDACSVDDVIIIAECGSGAYLRLVTKIPTMKPLDSDKKGSKEVSAPAEATQTAPVVEEKIDFSNVQIEPLFEDQVDFDTFSKSDFRAVKVKECEAVKKSKKLLKFVLDDGTGVDRVILSGIHEYYEPEELVGKTCIAITNLPPRAMMGIDSCGMLISAVHHENGEEKLHLLMVDPHIPAGAKLY